MGKTRLSKKERRKAREVKERRERERRRLEARYVLIAELPRILGVALESMPRLLKLYFGVETTSGRRFINVAGVEGMIRHYVPEERHGRAMAELAETTRYSGSQALQMSPPPPFAIVKATPRRRRPAKAKRARYFGPDPKQIEREWNPGETVEVPPED